MIGICDTAGSGSVVFNPVCGNGLVQSGELCDDGNTGNNDGCTSTCTIQSGYICTGTSIGSGPSNCAVVSICGNNVMNSGEICDDGNLSNGDGCSNICTIETGFACITPTNSTGPCTSTGVTDIDGVASNIEDAGPNSGDANMDGIIDSLQPNVATFISPMTNTYMTLVVTNGCNIANGVYHEPETGNYTTGSLQLLDPYYHYYIGLHGFLLKCLNTGDSTTVTFIWDQLYDTSLRVDYMKFDPFAGIYFSIS